MKGEINIHNYEAFLLDYAEGNLDAQTLEDLKAFVKAHPQLEIELDSVDLPHLTGDAIASGFKNELFKNENSLSDERLIAYLENKLSQPDKAKFEKELLSDKDLQKELVLYRKTILSPVSEIHFDKSVLFKTDDDVILNNMPLAYIENQLSEPEKLNFEKELEQNKILKADLTLLSKTILVADTTVVHPDKESLKKESKLILLFGYRNLAAVAAAILLLFGLFTLTRYFYNQQIIQPKQGLSQNKNRPDSIVVKSPVTRTINPLRITKKSLAQTPSPETNEVKQAAKSNRFKHKQLQSTEKKLAQTTTQTTSPTTNSVNQLQTHDVTPILAVNKSTPVYDSINHTLPLKTSNTAVQEFQSLNQLALESDFDDDEPAGEGKKTGFWQRVAKVAKRANAIGIKSIDGEENENNSVLISFNALSIEKK